MHPPCLTPPSPLTAPPLHTLTRIQPHTLLQAKEEGIVAYVSNMWDTYFEGGRDHRLDRLSITQLPYYDGGCGSAGLAADWLERVVRMVVGVAAATSAER